VFSGPTGPRGGGDRGTVSYGLLNTFNGYSAGLRGGSMAGVRIDPKLRRGNEGSIETHPLGLTPGRERPRTSSAHRAGALLGPRNYDGNRPTVRGALDDAL